MHKIIKNVKFLKKNLVEQHKLSKIIMPLSIINAILFEGTVLVGVFLPSFMLRIASGIYTIEQSVIFAASITAAIPILSLLQNIVNRKINNEQEKLFNIRIGRFDAQLHGLSLETAESNECLEFEEEALMGVYQTQNVVFEIFSVLLGRIITIITTSIIFINVHFMLVVFVVLTLLVIFALDEKAVKVEQLHNKAISKKRHIRGYISEIMFSIDYGAEERLYNIKDFLISKYNNNEKNIRTLENKRSFSKMKYQASLAFMNALQTIGIYGFAIWQFSSDNIQLYDFLIYISAALMMSGAIRQVFNSYTTLSTMALYYEATERYMALPVCGSLDGHDPMPTHITDIIFENVSFTYPNQISPAVDNLSFRFSGNDIVAIVGENGAGKSTIIKLLLRLYKIDSGRILLNGKSIYSYDWIEYKLFQLGTEPSALLYGMNAVYPVGYNSTVSISGVESIAHINKVMYEQSRDADLIIVGGQAGVLPLDEGNLNCYNYAAIDLLYATLPDAIILCINPSDEISFIKRTIGFVESIANCKVIALAVYPFYYAQSDIMQQNLLKMSRDVYMGLYEKKFAPHFTIPVILPNNNSDIHDLCNLIEDYFCE